jgi:formiminoglutamase
VARVKAKHGVAIVYDCHSIRSHIPFLFDGTLPDLNIGTDNGRTCDPLIATRVEAMAQSSRFTSVSNGRFRGGWTTRHYGQPQQGVHAIQMEIAQSAYLDSESPPWAFSAAKALSLQQVLAGILEALTDIAPSLARHA